ncbi:MAG: hypothetical protein GY809_20980 [Planctomycetes bacterium]|nr:hypothetical protein [Planctomycetota bacterium]
MKQIRNVKSLVKTFDIDTDSEANEAVLTELLQAQAEHLGGEKLSQCKNVSRDSFWVRSPRLGWTCGLAAVVIAVIASLAYFDLAGQVADLKHALELAQRDVVVARTEGRLEEAHNVRQETLSTISHRVEELEDRMPRLSSASRIYYPEAAYYRQNNQDSL